MENIFSRFFRRQPAEQSPSDTLVSILLKELSESEDPELTVRKFVRQGKRIALNPKLYDHMAIAEDSGIKSYEVDDAGLLKRGEEKGQIIVEGGSIGLYVYKLIIRIEREP